MPLESLLRHLSPLGQQLSAWDLPRNHNLKPMNNMLANSLNNIVLADLMELVTPAVVTVDKGADSKRVSSQMNFKMEVTASSTMIFQSLRRTYERDSLRHRARSTDGLQI